MYQRRDFGPDKIFHAYNRGHKKEKIFLDKQDHRYYILKMGEYAKECSIEILMYCLMPNHVHLCLRQVGETGLNKFFQKVHTSYASYFNKKYFYVGHLFQSRFACKEVETDEYLIYLFGYIHRNPDKITKNIFAYEFSSLRCYSRNRSCDSCVSKNTLLKTLAANNISVREYIMNFKKQDA